MVCTIQNDKMSKQLHRVRLRYLIYFLTILLLTIITVWILPQDCDYGTIVYHRSYDALKALHSKYPCKSDWLRNGQLDYGLMRANVLALLKEKNLSYVLDSSFVDVIYSNDVEGKPLFFSGIIVEEKYWILYRFDTLWRLLQFYIIDIPGSRMSSPLVMDIESLLDNEW